MDATALIAEDEPLLAEHLRATLGASRAALHPLADEFARVADYVQLLQVRMGARLTTRIDLPPELAAHPVPPLLLQPLVENAIRHGLEPRVGAVRLTLSARRDGPQLVLEVRDTGVGLPAGFGAALSAPAADGSGFGLQQVRERLHALHGMALRNVRERLRLMHDVAAQFDTRQEPDVFRVEIVLPLAS